MMFFSHFAHSAPISELLTSPAAPPAPASTSSSSTSSSNSGTSPHQGWLNTTRAITAEDMNGRLVLLDFWTYGCINCMQIVPDLNYLEEKYGNKLLIIGVHSAKFKGEANDARILSAAQRFGIHHPLINDDFTIWNRLGVRAWPTLILFAPDGEEIARYSGEGHRDDLDRDIMRFAKLVSNDSDLKSLTPTPQSQSALAFPARIKPYDGGFMVADSGHNQIVIFDQNMKETARIGGGQRGLKDGDFATAQFNHPRGLTAVNDKIYVADTDNHAVRMIDMTSKTITTLAGNGQRGVNRMLNHADAKTISLASPWDVAVMPGPDGKKSDGQKSEGQPSDGLQLVIASAGLHQLHLYDFASNTVSLLAGNGGEDIIDGPAKSAELAQPSALQVVGDAVYFLDAETSSLRVLKDGKIKTLIGTGLFDFGLKDGLYPNALMQHAQGLTYVPGENGGQFYIADTYNDAIRVYDLGSQKLSTYQKIAPPNSEPGDVLVKDDKLYIVFTNQNKIEQSERQSESSSKF
ncbi:MAG: hypothetical protein JNK24_05485 [Alphaproteobacteria bacterium]|nr:hypothetical protein [Alphaproteobacteria bacterium]